MKKRNILKVAVAAAAVLTTALPMSVAEAAPPPDPHPGYDGSIDLIRGSGSDTTYLMLQYLERVYNQLPGCTNNKTVAGNGCEAVQPPFIELRENYDHDVAVSDYPTGSSNGVQKLIEDKNGGAPAGHQVDYARSSRNRRTDGSENSVWFSGYAKGGLSIITFQGGPNIPSLTQAQAKGIFVDCTITDWSQLGLPAGPIRPYGVQSGSGTYLSFRDWIGGDPNTCANAIGTAEGTNRVFFENNTAPIDGGQTTDGEVLPTVADRANAIWWMEFADILTNKSRRGTAKTTPIDPDGAGPLAAVAPSPGGISNNSYPITRYMWHVNWEQDIVDGNNDAAGGRTGASAAFRYWICKSGNARHGVNFNTGNNVNTDITNSISQAGFVRLPTGEGQLNPITNEVERCRIDVTL
jgi:ABC-type phosphate transport system substrate-binding protein